MCIRDRVIGTVCRLDPVKNLDFMIACMPAIVRSVPDAKLIIAGDGSERASLIAKAASLGVSSSVRFLGLRRDTEKIMPALDVYCLLYTSDAADERSSVDLVGRRIIKKKKHTLAWERISTYRQDRTEHPKETSTH